MCGFWSLHWNGKATAKELVSCRDLHTIVVIDSKGEPPVIPGIAVVNWHEVDGAHLPDSH